MHNPALSPGNRPYYWRGRNTAQHRRH